MNARAYAEMHIYTIILDVNGGNFVSQVSANSVEEALKQWSMCVDDRILETFKFADRMESQNTVTCAIDEDENSITRLKDMQSVWFFYLRNKNVEGFINIVKTAIDVI
jgi:hypothetical protein